MKTRLFKCGLILALLSLVIAPLGHPARAEEPSLEDQIEASVVKGLTWLAANQNPDGSWGSGCDSIAYTAMVVLKFETRAIELGLDPLGPEYEYSGLVQSGLAYIMGFKQTMPINPQPAGNPDSDGDGIGVYFDWCGWHQVYSTGIAMMALAASGHPEIYKDDLQDAVDYMAWAQADDYCGVHRGGWRYWGNGCDSDNSNSGYVTLGLGYAAAPPPWGFGLAIPQFVKDELSLWADMIQDDVNGDGDDGGSWYDPYNSWVNILKTGNLIYEFGLTGDGPDTQQVKDAVDYIERHWFDSGGGNAGWRDHRQAMFTMMKGLSALGIEKIDLDGDGTAEHDWFTEVALHLISTQNPDGSWPGDPWADQIMSTAWALLTLEKAVPELEIPVPVDIKPGSCPNPFNLNEKGVLPVAIAGTADFDVTQVDPATVRLIYSDQEVAPLRWTYEDVATPYEPYLGKPLDAYACHKLGADGFQDLTLKFDSMTVAAMLTGVADGQVLILTLTGALKEEFGGTPIHGEDVVKIILKK
jgi:hypothetical protein